VLAQFTARMTNASVAVIPSHLDTTRGRQDSFTDVVFTSFSFMFFHGLLVLTFHGWAALWPTLWDWKGPDPSLARVSTAIALGHCLTYRMHTHHPEHPVWRPLKETFMLVFGVATVVYYWHFTVG
jgi:hypothetical protein